MLFPFIFLISQSPIPITPNPHSLRSWGPRVPQSPIPNPHYPLSPEGAPSSPIPHQGEK
ncbi:hypothetical protein FDUTEX481_08123 [Tolypothrix sp. PCC 7601]|nr:hypothetical protein FDUTEX481_08123 [Tolypothrix sp. PCC 7601]